MTSLQCLACKKIEHLDGWDVSYEALTKDSVLFRFICPHCESVKIRWYHS